MSAGTPTGGSGLGGLIGSLNPIGAALGGVGSILGPILGFFSNRAKMNQQKEQASRIAEGANFERDLMTDVWDPLRQNLLGQQDLSNLLSFGTAENPGVLLRVLDTLQGQPEMLQSLFSGLGINPEQAQFLDPLSQWAGGQQGLGEGLAGRSGNASGISDQLSQFYSGLMGGGLSQDGFNAGTPLLQHGGQTQGTNFVKEALQQIVGTGGKNADLTALMQLAMGGAATGGMTKDLQGGLNRANSLLSQQNPAQLLGLQSAQNILQSGGTNTQSQQAQNIGLDILGNRGQNADTKFLSQQGQDRFGQNPLLKTQDAVGYMATTLGSQAVKNAAAARQQAAMRGGGQGAIVDSGGMNLAKRAASDQYLDTFGSQIGDTLRQQQSLGLQNNQLGMNSIAQGGNLANDQFGKAAGLFGQGQNADISRFNTGAGLLDTMLGRGLQQDATGFSGLNQTQGTADARLNQFLQTALGGNGQAQSSLLGSLSQLGGNNAQELQNLLGGDQLQGNYFTRLMQAAGGQRDTAGLDTALAQLGLGFQNQASNNMNQGLQGTNTSLANNRDTLSSYLNAINNNLQMQTGLGNSFLNMGNNANQGLGGLVGSSNSGFASLLQSLGGIFR